MEIIELTSRIIGDCNEIIPAAKLISDFKNLSNEENQISHKVLGKSIKGVDIDLYSIGTGEKNVLWYGLPDPGEAVGGTVIWLLVNAIIQNQFTFDDITWNFIPCLNFDDQPNEGLTVEKIMKSSEQEVDWMLTNPRPETTAIVECANTLKPFFSYPMHDEFHCDEKDIPIYFPVSEILNRDISEEIRNLIKEYGLKISSEISHKEMGDGFFNMKEVEDYSNSTFSKLAEHGTVFICEVPDSENISINNLLKAQLSCGLTIQEYKSINTFN